MKKLTLFISVFIINICIFAQIPSGYYSAAEGKKQSELRLSLKTIITTGHSVTSYNGLWAAYQTTDVNPSTGKIWDVYSDCSFTWNVDQNKGTTGAECLNYNREHTTPQSWFGEASPMVSDLFNVYPTDSKVNGMRGNYPYGEVSAPTYTSGNGSKLGANTLAGYTGTAFEPIDRFKGDLARTYFYMATRYAGQCESWSGEGANVYSSSNLGLTAFAKDLFLKWSRLDPVSPKEISRNDAVQSVQHNRNPFIDYPELAEYIWGTKQTEAFSTLTGINNQLFRPSIYYSNSEIVVEDFTSEGCLSLYDLQGKLISKNLIYAGATKIPIKEKGVVISVISSNKGSYTKKINILQ